MTVSLLEREFPNDHLPLLRWLMFTGVSAFGFIIAWYYGLFHLMLANWLRWFLLLGHGNIPTRYSGTDRLYRGNAKTPGKQPFSQWG